MENAIPVVIKPLLAEFGKIVTDDAPDALRPLRNIQHQIDLSRKTTLLVSISNEVLGFNSIKELYASDEDFRNAWMELETKQHRGEFILLDGYLFKGNRLCIPKTFLRSQLIKEIQVGGMSAHLGRDKTIVSVESRFSWPQLNRDVGAFVKRCVVCQEGKVMLKVSPWKGVIRFGKQGKLNLRYIGPFKVLAKVGTIAYRLEFPQQLSRVHSTLHVSNLKKCLSDEPLAIPLDEIHVDDKLHFVEEPVEIMDHEVKRLKQSRIPIIKSFVGSLERLSSHGNVKSNFERSIRISSQKPHPRQVPRLEPCEQGLFNGGRL
ncbi:putative reverse transcriptase domain-containing protein [Tanacetum coccineum]|uniref:Reverse transcriptase domain-containing protein n=1 Tax=Tanacetum coccineum TaxID=301880 RepID=A0ABQ5EQW2_9ASTR